MPFYEWKNTLEKGLFQMEVYKHLQEGDFLLKNLTIYFAQKKPFYRDLVKSVRPPLYMCAHTPTFCDFQKRYPPLKNFQNLNQGENIADRKNFSLADFLLIKKIKRIIFLCSLLEIKSIYSFLEVLFGVFTPHTFSGRTKMWTHCAPTYTGRFI